MAFLSQRSTGDIILEPRVANDTEIPTLSIEDERLRPERRSRDTRHVQQDSVWTPDRRSLDSARSSDDIWIPVKTPDSNTPISVGRYKRSRRFAAIRPNVVVTVVPSSETQRSTPSNTIMSPTLVTINASEPLQAILDVIARDGGVIVSNFLPPDLLKETMSSSKYELAVVDPIPRLER
jgi:hypothetical protein